MNMSRVYILLQNQKSTRFFTIDTIGKTYRFIKKLKQNNYIEFFLKKIASMIFIFHIGWYYYNMANCITIEKSIDWADIRVKITINGVPKKSVTL
jgi:hypothetical protein